MRFATFSGVVMLIARAALAVGNRPPDPPDERRHRRQHPAPDLSHRPVEPRLVGADHPVRRVRHDHVHGRVRLPLSVRRPPAISGSRRRASSRWRRSPRSMPLRSGWPILPGASLRGSDRPRRRVWFFMLLAARAAGRRLLVRHPQLARRRPVALGQRAGGDGLRDDRAARHRRRAGGGDVPLLRGARDPRARRHPARRDARRGDARGALRRDPGRARRRR